MSASQLSKLSAIFEGGKDAGSYLPEDERAALDRAQRSVVEARRQAETREGNFQIY